MNLSKRGSKALIARLEKPRPVRYEIHEVLGRGGMGEVFRATDRDTGQVVALKALRTDLLLPRELFERFEREGEALRRLNHPNIVKALGSFEEGGRTYLVMEYVAGGSLRALLARPLAPERLLGIALDEREAFLDQRMLVRGSDGSGDA